MRKHRQGAGRAIVVAALSAFTTAALALSLAPAEREAQALLEGGAVWALALVGLCALYGAAARLGGAWRMKRLWALAALFAGVVTLGRSFAAVGNMGLIALSARTVVYFGGRAALYYAGMRLLLEALCGRGSAERAMPRCASLTFGGVLLLFWLPWAASLYPGTVSNDSITQLKEIMGVVPLSNGNPIFQTFLVAAFRQTGLWLGSADAGVALYCGVQALLMAWLLGALAAEMYASPAPRWLCWGTLAFYGLCPVFPVFAFCVGKDTNFAMSVLFLSLTMWRIVRAEGAPRMRDTVCLCLAAVLCTLLRNPGVFLAMLAVGLLLGWMLRHRRGWRASWALGSVAAVYAVLHLLVIPALHIAPTPETENYSVPLQQVARVAVGDALTPEEADIVDGVLRLSEVRAAYNGELSDPVKNLWREDATPQAKAAFWRAWPRIVLRNPATCLSATFHNTYGYLYPGYMSVIKPTLLIGDQGSRTASVKGLYDYSINPQSRRVKEWTEALAANPLYRVLVSPGLYGWITLFAVACLTRRRGAGALLCAVPALFTLAGCMLSAVNGYFRYAMPLYLCAPMLLWLVGEGARRQSTRQSPEP